MQLTPRQAERTHPLGHRIPSYLPYLVHGFRKCSQLLVSGAIRKTGDQHNSWPAQFGSYMLRFTVFPPSHLLTVSDTTMGKVFPLSIKPGTHCQGFTLFLLWIYLLTF